MQFIVLNTYATEVPDALKCIKSHWIDFKVLPIVGDLVISKIGISKDIWIVKERRFARLEVSGEESLTVEYIIEEIQY